ncbi:DUF488 domain-containing protein [Weissella halotolerans]|uniref:Uroporphyrin-III c-methyltransferase n=1 Tax=Weissella halotolerans DSM 20190 TaxID=1123500 RepID=A0A0R2G2Q2_9LACO|nr:DUF488 family protein [Weissella halotolerans]KRN31245.1 hypothetical protein IV68_GL001128 [Weissella halotolerans DSM 20190]
MQIKTMRIYDSFSDTTDYRILVDRLWPRGISKEKAALDVWFKAIAPSTELREWFAHQPDKFTLFTQKYEKELAANPETSLFIQLVATQLAQQQDIVLLYGARNQKDNQAIVLQKHLMQQPSIKQFLS